MNEEQQLIVDTAKRIFQDQCDKPVVDAAECGADGSSGTFPQELWNTLEQTGLTSIGVDAGSFADALLVLREAGASAAPIPLAEHLIALQLLAAAKVDAPAGILTVANAAATNVRFTEVANHIVLVADDSVSVIENRDLDWQRSGSMAGETRASLDGVVIGKQVPLDGAADLLLHLGARARVNMMSGAMSETLAMSVQYVSDREQFGRSLSKFQAIQHQLAIMAGEVAACQRAADSTLETENPLDIAIAKSRVGEGVTQVTDFAHQVHGAIGYTLEHGLNHRTRRLWQWRDEYGAERYWQLMVGKHFCANGADSLWNSVTALA